MSSSTCSCTRRTSVAFDGGIVLERCAAHETQRWTLGGRVVQRAEALRHLSALFTASRGLRSTSAPGVRQAAPAPAPRVVVLPADAPTDERLTALLQSRGLQGSWAVA